MNKDIISVFLTLTINWKIKTDPNNKSGAVMGPMESSESMCFQNLTGSEIRISFLRKWSYANTEKADRP